MTMKKNPFSMQLNAEDFIPATEEEKQGKVFMRESVGFWKDGFRRFRKNKIAMVSLFLIIVIAIMAYIVPIFYPYDYKTQTKGNEKLAPMEYSQQEQQKIEEGEKIFPHILGTDRNGRDYAARLLIGTRVSLTVGLVASALVLLIGALYGSIAGYVGGKTDMIMMRVVDMIYTIPDLLIIILLSVVLKFPLQNLAEQPGFGWINKLGPNLIGMFIVFALLYWVSMARIVRSQILTLKQQEYVTAAKALGASGAMIIRKHLLKNCIGTLIVTTTLQIPSAIFTESFLSFLGMGVSAPMSSLGSLANDALPGINSYPHLLLAPAIMIAVIILSFNLLGDGLRDAFDPKMKN